ncbi:MAG: WG repeat-containing protein [Bacteroidales bacterium]|nr:WG repeat-containing protein [Bacteroidales bacterium]
MKTNFFLTIVIYAIVSLMASSCGIDDNKIYPVKIGDNWGYVDNNGRYLVNPQFEEAYYFNCGLARVVKDGKVGYINHHGRYVINPEYASGTSFS